MARAIDIADYIIIKASDLNRPVSNLQLQKVMYFLNAIYLVKNGSDKPLIDDERFQRWSFGPVMSSVYYEYSNNGGMAIERTQDHGTLSWDEKENDWKFNSQPFVKKEFCKKNSHKVNFINTYVEELLKYPAYKLVGYSHMESQWKNKDNNELYDNNVTYNSYNNNDYLSNWLRSVISNSENKNSGNE